MQTHGIRTEQPSRIVLVGFMGAGKSTVGPILAMRLGWDFVDVDLHLEEKSGMKVAEIFSTAGEPTFRQMESLAIRELHDREKLVLALGGGAVESDETRSLLSRSIETCVVFLKAPFEVAIARCEDQPGSNERPLLKQRETLRQRFDSRLSFYEEAHITVSTEGLDPNAVVDRILYELNHFASPISQHSKAIVT